MGTYQLSSSVGGTYTISVRSNQILQGADSLVERLQQGTSLVVTTGTVDRLYGAQLTAALDKAGVRHHYEVVVLNEHDKTLESVMRICAVAQLMELRRDSHLIAFGGGVCSDICGMAASMIRRGIPHVRIPTTLVAQVDAAIGLKSGINFGGHKNYLGCFHPPAAVFVDPAFLQSLNRDQLRDGLAEIVKVAIAADPDLFNMIERSGTELLTSGFTAPAALTSQVIERSIAGMVRALAENPYENRGYRREMDLGHTFSPTLESASGFALSHGKAVSIDMALSSVIAHQAGRIDATCEARILGTIASLGLPLFNGLLTVGHCVEAIRRSLQHRGGELNLVVPDGIGRATFLPASAVPPVELAAAIDRLQGYAAELLADIGARRGA